MVNIRNFRGLTINKIRWRSCPDPDGIHCAPQTAAGFTGGREGIQGKKIGKGKQEREEDGKGRTPPSLETNRRQCLDQANNPNRDYT